MADKTVRVYDKLHDEYIDLRVRENGDGSFSQDSFNSTVGKTDDAAVISDANGTVSAKLRGVLKIFVDLWDTSLHAFRVTLASKIMGIVTGLENDNILTMPARRADAFQVKYDALSNTTPQQVKVGTSGKSVYITDISISTDITQSVQIQDNNSTPEILIPRKFLPANSAWLKSYITPKQVAPGKDINVVTSGSANSVTVEINGYIY